MFLHVTSVMSLNRDDRQAGIKYDGVLLVRLVTFTKHHANFLPDWVLYRSVCLLHIKIETWLHVIFGPILCKRTEHCLSAYCCIASIIDGATSVSKHLSAAV
jgi:hypothetical protein